MGSLRRRSRATSCRRGMTHWLWWRGISTAHPLTDRSTPVDARHFDDLIRSLAFDSSRRRLLAGLTGGLLAMLSLSRTSEEAAARSGKCKQACSLCEQCKKGKCKRKNGRKRRTCKAGTCQPKATGTACGGGTCINGGCATACGAPSPPGNCSGASCAGPTCPGGESCGTCDTTTEGQVVCGDLRPSCQEFQACETTANCPLGSVCVTNGCCAFVGKPNICVRPV